MTSKNKTVIVLGSEGALGSELIQNLLQKNTFDIVAVDQNKKTQFATQFITRRGAAHTRSTRTSSRRTA